MANRDWWTWSRWFWGSAPPGWVALIYGSPWTWTACSSESTSPGRFALYDENEDTSSGLFFIFPSQKGGLDLSWHHCNAQHIMYCERECVCVCVVGTSAGSERQAEEAERTDLSTTLMSSIMQKHSKTVLNYSSLHSSHQGLNSISHT